MLIYKHSIIQDLKPTIVCLNVLPPKNPLTKLLKAKVFLVTMRRRAYLMSGTSLRPLLIQLLYYVGRTLQITLDKDLL